MKKLSRFVLGVLLSLSVLGSAGTPARAQDNANVGALDAALSISVGQDSNGRWFAILQNSQIRVRYAYFFEGSAQTAIQDFVIKSVNEDQAGSYLDATAGRGLMTSATVTYDGTDRKTVRLEWNNGSFRQDVSIYPDSAYIRIDYLKFGVNFVDIGTPGGGSSGNYEFYGNSCWLSCSNPRGYVLYEDSYYNRYPGDGINDPADGGSLNYKGYFIGGIYRSSNNRGYGRVMPVNTTNIIKLLFNRGFEWYAYFGQSHQSFTGYLFVVTGGANEIISLGKQIADQGGQPPPTTYTLTANVSGSGSVSKNPNKSSYNPGEVVTLTATASPGWTFTGWSGDLTGTANPKQITMNGNKTVTANFTQNPPTTYTLTANVSGSGSVSRNPNKSSYNPGEVVTLTATASPGWTFTGWSGDLTGTNNPKQITMNGNRTVTASFALVPVTGGSAIYLPLVMGGQP